MCTTLQDHEKGFTMWEGYVDWRNRAAIKGCHGGAVAASFVLVVEILENLAYLANASNLVLYLSKFMNFSPSASANIVTNFMGTSFFLALLGGFSSDFFSTYYIYIISATIEFMGLLMLTLQACIPSLRQPICASVNRNAPCKEVGGGHIAMLFSGLYLVALGVGGIKGSLPSHGAEQFDENTPQGRKHRSSFFNYYIFCLACGALIAVTLVVWIEDNKGWQWGFGISTVAILSSIVIFLLGSRTYRIKVPTGSPMTTIFKVLVAAFSNSLFPKNSIGNVLDTRETPQNTTEISEEEGHGERNTEIQTEMKDLKFIGKATVENTAYPSLHCTVKQVQDVKIVVQVVPIFMSTVMLNCCLAQLSTFSVQQAATMNTYIGALKVPPASLPIFPVIFTMILAPVYNHIIIPFARAVTKSEMGITHLQRIGTGLFLSVVAMAVAALVEMKRKRVAEQSGLMNSTEPLPITFLWVALQYLFLGSADLFSLAGLMEFFFTEAPLSMRSLTTALSWASLAMGYYLSSVIVSIVNHITGRFQQTPWLYGSNLNHYHLERFYWLMCILSGLNFFHYLLWATRYKYRSTMPDDERDQLDNTPSEA
ncbi:protein NRT1/ PTR FAMILY 4.6-like [Solanum stenotomum]|uniref:protein NRT1/ PTR FAMILY 4.6-like n=1 Tax=Solanum stenotomum TaxID=172797 RepID=UPI0020D155FD|nr:protein NRT1/ PTR FAMILY 4.6-like [Solanum stenotomum]